MNGYFSQEAMEAFMEAVGEENFSEGLFDFTRCVRPNGTAYGTNGKCRKGTENNKEVDIQSQYTLKAKKAQEAMAKGDMATALKLNKEAMDIMSRITAKNEKDNPETEKREIKIKGVVDKLKKSGNTNLSSDSEGAYITDKVGKNEIKTLITPKTDGSYEIGYKVNNSYAKGEITDRREQIRIALTAKRQFDVALKSLPDGTKVRAIAFDDDGNGDARRAAYEKLGFKHQGNNILTGVVRNGKVEMMDFAERGSEESKAWYLILFGFPN